MDSMTTLPEPSGFKVKSSVVSKQPVRKMRVRLARMIEATCFIEVMFIIWFNLGLLLRMTVTDWR